MHELKETCESQKHLICMNNKRPAGGMYELQNSAKQKKINEPNREAICHGQKKRDQIFDFSILLRMIFRLLSVAEAQLFREQR